jgi:hypothetical protein
MDLLVQGKNGNQHVSIHAAAVLRVQAPSNSVLVAWHVSAHRMKKVRRIALVVQMLREL